MPPFELIDVPNGPTPVVYRLSPGEAMRLDSVTAIFDGSAAAFAFLPTLSFYAQSGELLARQFAELQQVGEVSEVTFAPFLRKPPPAAAEDLLPSLCGGLDAGPVASGTAVGRVLTLALTRGVPCACVVHVVPVMFAGAQPFPTHDAPASVVDSHGNVFFHGGTDANIGAISDDAGGPPWDSLSGGDSWIRSYAANDLSAGDTITITYGAGTPLTAKLGAMAFAVIHTTFAAQAQFFGGAGPIIAYGNSDSFPTTGANPAALDWCADLTQCGAQEPTPQHFGAMIALAASAPANTGYAPNNGVVIGTLDEPGGAFSLAVSFDRCVQDDDHPDPGGTWDNAANVLVGNYQFTRFVCPPP